MRSAALSILLALVHSLSAQVGLRINEVQVAHGGEMHVPVGSSPDWIELYNSTERSIDLQGMRLVVADRQHLFEASLPIAPAAHLLLWCDGHPERGAEHIGFKLTRSGGSVVLVAKDRSTILDSFTWPALPSGSSMGRVPDGGKAWSYFAEPSPGRSAASAAPLIQRIATSPKPQLSEAPDGTALLTLSADVRDMLHYTLDGSAANATHGTLYTGPILLLPGSVLRARAFAKDALPSAELALSHSRPTTNGPRMALIMDPAHLWSDSSGINTPGHFANHTRKGMDWERPALLAWGPDSLGHAMPVGIRISGSGSRGAHKRSFKVHARSRYDSPAEGLPIPGWEYFDEGILRADAGAHAFLRGRLIETLVQGHQLHVYMQFSTPIELHLNGRYWGLYRWMPPKDAAWVKHISGAEAVDLLAGPAAVVRSGSGKQFHRAIRSLTSGASADSIGLSIDLDNLIDLACIDLWTGRADHDLNVRCYRPRQTGGKWRWILYDLDLWSPAAENSVERMCSATSLETPYLPQLMAHSELSARLLARMTALQATVFQPGHAQAVLDSLFVRHEDAMVANHKRWELELDTTTPAHSRKELAAFIAQRPEHLMAHLARQSGMRLRRITMEVPAPDQGIVLLEGLRMNPGRNDFQSFEGLALRVEVRAAEGWEFAGWKGQGADGATTHLDAGRSKHVKPLFRPLLP